ncbi:hypothetical protein L3Q72_08010 [Vibrio sp. JC009]|uniref:hypothetical protein n=1 Tax=Vibrio sp. JC009 TaxID=2912314 RepID=UPI0023AF6DCE|nr:hypothetical protein [Vibrio sp. JC009]WED20597.1 hypothetical protein L3Q72_08010 [Vibrio sp. JC009]
MQNNSKIEVWYKVSGDHVLLGETSSSKKMDVISLWVSLPFDTESSELAGYELTLVDDDGRKIGSKKVTQEHAEIVLGKQQDLEFSQLLQEFVNFDRQDSYADWALT